jgi:glycosyltransferase involved in cell wall biosynthesis
MRILIALEETLDSIGGIQTHCSFLKQYIEKENEVSILTSKSITKFKIFNKCLISKIQAIRKIKEFNPDIIHVHGFSSFFAYQVFKIAIKLKYKVVYTPHYHPFKYHRFPLLAKLFFLTFWKSILPKTDMIVTLSHAERDFYLQFVSEKQVIIIPNGHSVFNENNEPHKKPLNNSFLFIGRTDHNKGFHLLIRLRSALEELKSTLTLVSSAKGKKIVSPFFVKSNLSKTELEKLIRNSIALIVPSKYEAFSLVALESLACGTPIIISDRVQIKSYFENVDFVKIFDYNKEEELISLVKHFAEMPPEKYYKLSVDACAMAKSFHWEIITNELICKYKSLINC